MPMEPSKSKSALRSRLQKYTALVHQDLSATYSRDLHEWLLIAPVIGVLTGLAITLVAKIILSWMWPPILRFYLANHWMIVPGVVIGFVIAGLIMQYLTPDPDEHSTEEIIRSYHEHRGDIQMRSFVPSFWLRSRRLGLAAARRWKGPAFTVGARSVPGFGPVLRGCGANREIAESC